MEEFDWKLKRFLKFTGFAIVLVAVLISVYLILTGISKSDTVVKCEYLIYGTLIFYFSIGIWASILKIEERIIIKGTYLIGVTLWLIIFLTVFEGKMKYLGFFLISTPFLLLVNYIAVRSRYGKKDELSIIAKKIGKILPCIKRSKLRLYGELYDSSNSFIDVRAENNTCLIFALDNGTSIYVYHPGGIEYENYIRIEAAIRIVYKKFEDSQIKYVEYEYREHNMSVRTNIDSLKPQPSGKPEIPAFEMKSNDCSDSRVRKINKWLVVYISTLVFLILFLVYLRVDFNHDAKEVDLLANKYIKQMSVTGYLTQQDKNELEKEIKDKGHHYMIKATETKARYGQKVFLYIEVFDEARMGGTSRIKAIDKEAIVK